MPVCRLALSVQPSLKPPQRQALAAQLLRERLLARSERVGKKALLQLVEKLSRVEIRCPEAILHLQGRSMLWLLVLVVLDKPTDSLGK